jgi:hypothetical protein
MRPSYSHSPFATRSALLTNPMAGIPLWRPVETVLGWTEAQKAAWAVERDRGNLAAAEAAYASACKSLGQANASKVMRRIRVAAAFHELNVRRGSMIRARKALAASLAAVAKAAA